MASVWRFQQLIRCIYNVTVSKHIPALPAPVCTRQCSSGYYTPDDTLPPPPEYEEKHNETMEVRKARLLYQSRKRGMTENGLLLSTFAAKFLDKMDEKQVALYDKLINKPSNDWELYYWATGNKPTPEEYKSEIMDMLKEHAQNKNLDNRSTQPNLPVYDW